MFNKKGDKIIFNILPCPPINLKYTKPAVPINRVTNSWLILPNIVWDIALSLLFSFIYKILPPYSPIRLGVSMVILQPASTLLNAVKKDSFSSGAINNCHLRDSKAQFTIINKTTSHKSGLCNESLICCQRRSKSGCRYTFLYNIQHNKMNTTGPKNQLINILIFLCSQIVI